jgi:transposase-like protein
MPRKSGTERELRWREIVNRQAESGLSIREFCANEKVSQPSFYVWRKKFREREDEGTHARKPRRSPDDHGLFVPLELVDSAETLEVELVDSAETLEVVHPLGYRVRVIGDVNPNALRHVIEVLDGRGDR